MLKVASTVQVQGYHFVWQFHGRCNECSCYRFGPVAISEHVRLQPQFSALMTPGRRVLLQPYVSVTTAQIIWKLFLLHSDLDLSSLNFVPAFCSSQQEVTWK